MSDEDKTELGIEALTEDIHDPDKRRAAARIIRRNALVSKVLLWLTATAIPVIITIYITKFVG